MKIFLDAGHNDNGWDTGASRLGIREQDITYEIALAAGQLLSNCKLSRPNKTDVLGIDLYTSLTERAKMSNQYNADLFLSIHANSTNDESTSASGVECYVCALGGRAEQFARSICESISAVIGIPNRGVKTANYVVLTDTFAPAVLIECGFINNASDREKMVLRPKDYAKAIVDAVNTAYAAMGGQEQMPENEGNTPILSKPETTVTQMKAWAKSKQAEQLFVDLAETYYVECIKAGVDPAAAYCQSAKETAFMKFTGVLDASYCNPCGMKTSEGGGDYDANAHQRFDTWQQGISAHVDHLALYAGAVGYPKANTFDPRHFPWVLGTAKTVESLGGKWAPSASYGSDIVRMMQELSNTSYGSAAELGCSDWAAQGCQWAIDSGLILGDGSSYNWQRAITREEMCVILYRMTKM